MSKHKHIAASRRPQRGAVMVETALSLTVFLAFVLGAVEFGWMLFDWSRVAEATRAGVRHAVVSDPAFDISGVVGGCAAVSGPPSEQILDQMNRLRLGLTTDQVRVTYACAETGFAQRPQPVLRVTVQVTDVSHRLLLPQLVGLAPSIGIPGFASSRTSEDLHTVAAGAATNN